MSVEDRISTAIATLWLQLSGTINVYVVGSHVGKQENVNPASHRLPRSPFPSFPLCPGGAPVKKTGRKWHPCARLGASSLWWCLMESFMPWVDGTMVLPLTLLRPITLN